VSRPTLRRVLTMGLVQGFILIKYAIRFKKLLLCSSNQIDSILFDELNKKVKSSFIMRYVKEVLMNIVIIHRMIMQFIFKHKFKL